MRVRFKQVLGSLFGCLTASLVLFSQTIRYQQKPLGSYESSSEHDTRQDTPKRHDDVIVEVFHPVTENGIHFFWNVCVESLNGSSRPEVVVYDRSAVPGRRLMKVAGSTNTEWNHWDFHFKADPVPYISRRSMLSETAFFVATTFPGNIHHFWEDEFVPLYTIAKRTNRLYPGSRNRILYRTPDKNNARKRYEDVLFTLHVIDHRDAFDTIDREVCYRSGIFGLRPPTDRGDFREAVEHVLYEMDLKHLHEEPKYVTIIQRKLRIILNDDELVDAVKASGFQKVRVVYLEDLVSVREQVQVSASSSVFIGFHGAGLQWSIFMQAHRSYLVEIAWPDKYWPIYYDRFVGKYQINHRSVIATDVRANWTSYSARVRNGQVVSKVEKLELLKNPPKDHTDNIWKWADAVVEKNALLKVLTEIYKEIAKPK